MLLLLLSPFVFLMKTMLPTNMKLVNNSLLCKLSLHRKVVTIIYTYTSNYMTALAYDN